MFDKVEVGLILATGIRKLHEYQCLKGKREEVDIIPYSQLQKTFGANRRTIIECAQGYKYRYPKGVPTKVQFTLSKPEPEPEEEEQGAAAEDKDLDLTSALTELHFLVITGPPNPPKAEICLEKLAINALVRLSKGNVNAPLF